MRVCGRDDALRPDGTELGSGHAVGGCSQLFRRLRSNASSYETDVSRAVCRGSNMGKVLRFPQRQPGIVERLDTSVTCMYRLQAASGSPTDEMRVEALGARLDVASLRKAMHSVLSSDVAAHQAPAGVEHVWGRLEALLEQVAICASSSYSEHPTERNKATRAQLRGACQAALRELYHLRSMLAPMDCQRR